jgi:hypothetical protein
MYNHITCCKSENKNWIKMKKNNLPKIIVYTQQNMYNITKERYHMTSTFAINLNHVTSTD